MNDKPKGRGKWVAPADPNKSGPFAPSHWTFSPAFTDFDEDPNLPPPGVPYRRGNPFTAPDGHTYNTWLIPARDPGVEHQIVDYASLVKI